jgi:cyanuric acid amidohydrolase
MQTLVYSLPMAHPGDLSALDELILSGIVKAQDVVAVIGKTEGNGGVNDFTRGYFTQSLMQLLSSHLGTPAEELLRTIPCILSGGTEGVLSPHYVVFCRSDDPTPAFDGGQTDSAAALAIGLAFSEVLVPEHVGRMAQVLQVAESVRQAMHSAQIDNPADVHFVQVKCPCITAARVQEAHSRGFDVVAQDPNRAMAFSRAAGALGVALALGDIDAATLNEKDLLSDFSLFSSRASISSGVEVSCNEVIVLGNSTAWSGAYRIAHQPMADALDIAAVYAVLADLGLPALPQLPAKLLEQVAAVFVKSEPDRRGRVRANRHTMLEDTDINAQRHIRAALGGVVASVMGDGRIFVSGGAEHQGPDGGGLIAVIAGAVGVMPRRFSP